MEQVAPGGVRIVLPQGAFAALHERPSQFAYQGGRSATVLGVRLTYDPQRLVQAAVLERFSGLPHRQPCERGHGFSSQPPMFSLPALSEPRRRVSGQPPPRLHSRLVNSRLLLLGDNGHVLAVPVRALEYVLL